MTGLAEPDWDVVIVGAGTAGLMTAIFAARRGGRVLVIEAGDVVGGTLHISSGRMSAAGTRLQAQSGIEDTPEEHYDDVMRLCRGTADSALVRLAVDRAAETFDWLIDAGLPLATPTPVLGTGLHEPYLKARYAWGVELGRSILKVIEPRFQAAAASGKVSLRLKTRATDLVQDPLTRRVRGVRVLDAQGRGGEALGANTVLATGGFGASAALMNEIHGAPLYSVGAWAGAGGDGLKLGRAAGGYVRGANAFHGDFGVILESYDYPSPVLARAVTAPQRRPPWEIYVDSSGRRFIDEGEPSIDARERALAALPDRRYWIVFDEAILRQAPSVVDAWSVADVRAAFEGHGMFVKAGSLEDLARRAMMDPARLADSVDGFNRALNGADPFGREHRPSPILEAPFYAIRQHCTAIVSTAGLVVDGGLRVVDPAGEAIPGLFAAGEILGSVATMGDAAANGMLVTPAMVFGRLLGEEILAWPA